MKYGKIKGALYGILFLAAMILFIAGCGESEAETDNASEIQGEIAAVLAKGESINEITIIEKEKTREVVQYHVYCRIDTGDAGVVCEKCYLVIYCRKNGEWVWDEKRGVRLLGEKVWEQR